MSPLTKLYRRVRAALFPAARSAALRDFGGVGRTKEASREQRGLPRLESVLRDLRIAARSLGRTPGFAFVAVLTLGLGVGSATGCSARCSSV